MQFAPPLLYRMNQFGLARKKHCDAKKTVMVEHAREPAESELADPLPEGLRNPLPEILPAVGETFQIKTLRVQTVVPGFVLRHIPAVVQGPQQIVGGLKPDAQPGGNLRISHRSLFPGQHFRKIEGPFHHLYHTIPYYCIYIVKHIIHL